MTTKPQKIEGGRFSQAGMGASARIVQLKRLDRTVIEKIVTEEMSTEIEKARAEERQRCVDSLPKKLETFHKECQSCGRGKIDLEAMALLD